MQVLLIGGSRFLGREIARAFTTHGAEVFAMNRGNRPLEPELGHSIVCDKGDRTSFANVLRVRRWDVVVDTILNAEDLQFVVDTVGSCVGHFIHTGSLGVYGDARQIPATEALPLADHKGEEIVFDYKIAQDRVLLRAVQERGFPATILRQSYIYGPGDIPLDGWGGRSASFFHKLRDGEPLLLPSDGRALLHPGHVGDLARAFLHAALRPQSIGQVYNVAGPHAIMMRDYVALLAEALGVEPQFTFAPLQEVHARYPEQTNERGLRFISQHMCGSITKAKEQLGWEPQISLHQGLRENVAWMQEEGLV